MSADTMWTPPTAPDPTYRPPLPTTVGGLASLRAGAAAQGTLYYPGEDYPR